MAKKRVKTVSRFYGKPTANPREERRMVLRKLYAAAANSDPDPARDLRSVLASMTEELNRKKFAQGDALMLALAKALPEWALAKSLDVNRPVQLSFDGINVGGIMTVSVENVREDAFGGADISVRIAFNMGARGLDEIPTYRMVK